MALAEASVRNAVADDFAETPDFAVGFVVGFDPVEGFEQEDYFEIHVVIVAPETDPLVGPMIDFAVGLPVVAGLAEIDHRGHGHFL
jgi:hypothetical protein